VDAIKEWVGMRWHDTLVPLVVFVGSFIVLAWVRRRLSMSLGRWVRQTNWQVDDILIQALLWPSRAWVALAAVYLGLEASTLSGGWKVPIGRGLWTLLIISVAIFTIQVFGNLLARYGERWHSSHLMRRVSATVSAIVLAATVLTILDLWGVSVGPVLLALGLIAGIGIIALREVLPSILAFSHLSASGHIKVGDYIKLESGEEGEVEDMDWSKTQIRALDGSRVFVPTSRLLSTKVVNYGRPLKKAKGPFRFFSHTRIKELTGLKANDLAGLAEMLKTAPDSVVYYHTHHFLEEHQYLTPEPPNDFASWVTDVLGEEVLGEKLAAVDTFEFASLLALRERLVGIVEEHIVQGPNGRRAPAGQEFYFIKSVSFITPTQYSAQDLREFVQALPKLPLGSLYFHMFESRIRLGHSSNDFSAWIAESVGDRELAEDVSRLDPYQYTLEELRSQLIRLVEKRIK